LSRIVSFVARVIIGQIVINLPLCLALNSKISQSSVLVAYVVRKHMLILTTVQMNKDAFVAYLMMKGCAGNNEMFNLLCIFSTVKNRN